MTFPDNFFDCVTCGFGIMFFPDPGPWPRGNAAMLKPGGCLALSTWRVAQGDDLHPVLKEMGILSQSQSWVDKGTDQMANYSAADVAPLDRT